MVGSTGKIRDPLRQDSRIALDEEYDEQEEVPLHDQPGLPGRDRILCRSR